MKCMGVDEVLRGALLTVLLSVSTILAAQKPKDVAGAAEDKVMIYHAAAAAPGGVAIEDNVVFVGPMGMMGGGVVKGVPYSATATTEMTQQLADGNRIKHSNTSKTYRDSEGRTRRDQSLPAIGPFAVAGQASAEPPSLSFINDPVAGVTYVLNHTDKTARKMPASASMPDGGASGAESAAMPPLPPFPPPGGAGVRVFTRRIERAPAAAGAMPAAPENVRREDLGKKLIEGIEVEGTRTVMTIPAGAIGNELAIEITTEEWRSPVLQVMVSSKHADPRMGENTYQLSGISRAEPDASLFKVPGDYTLLEGGPTTFNLRVPAPTNR